MPAREEMRTTVYLVGAGPGDPSLLTLGAAQLLSEADIIVYDALVSPAIRSYFSPTARLEYVGKRAGRHSMTQEEINALLVDLAQEGEGLKIVRLKGGDPFVFGRGGEEMATLHSHGIAYEIVPGVTAGIAAPAYCGIPVTQRELSRSVTLITASTQQGGLPQLDWGAYARLEGTLVFYMSMRAVPEIARELMEHGMPQEHRAAIIAHGTLPSQRLLSQSLKQFALSTEGYEAYSPGLFVVGDVVAWGQDFAWYRPGRLVGQRIVVTRSEAQASSLSERLEREGAEVHLLPTIAITPTEEWGQIDEAIAHLDEYDWLLLTSANAVRLFFERLSLLGRDARALAGLSIGVIGQATQSALRGYGLEADFIPSIYTAEVMARELAPRLSPGQRVLLPQSARSSGLLAEGLRAAGAVCTELDLYSPSPIEHDEEYIRSLISRGTSWITLCSSSAATNFLDLVHRYGLQEELHRCRLAVIGTVTAETITAAGYSVAALPTKASIEALVEEIVQKSLP